MDIFAVQYSALVPILRTILNKSGFRELSLSGVRSKFYRHLFFIVSHASRCDAQPKDLDGPGNHRRTHEKTDVLIKAFDPGILWDNYGIQHEIVVRLILSTSDAH